MAKTDKRRSVEQAESLARRIWLAGLGAYGTSMEDAQGQLGRAGEEASRLFQELVEKGQRIEEQSRATLRNRLDEARHRISERAQSNTRSVEEMIQRVRDKIGIDAAVAAPLDALTQRVEGIARRLGAASTRPGKARASASAAAAPPGSAKKTSKAAKKPARTRATAPRKPARKARGTASAPARTAARKRSR